MKKIVIDRRDAMKGLGALAAGLATGVATKSSALAQPAIGRGATLTVSVWGGITEDGIKKYIQPEFERTTGAKLAFDIGGMGARYNKLLAQRANPPADVFFSTDEALVAGRRAGILVDASRKSLPNLADVYDWAHTVKASSADTVPGAPYTLLGYILGYDPKATKEPVTSWADMWRPEFAGKLAFAAPVHSIMPALVIIAAELNGGSATNIDPGFKKLAQLKPAKLTVFWTDWAPLNKSGDATIGTDFDYYLEAMKDQKYPIEPVIPKEKGLAAAQYVSIVKGTKNQELAEAFLNEMMAVKPQESFATQSFQGTINKKVRLAANIANRCSCGARVDQLRFFDPEFAANVRASWTERLNTEVVPSWRTR